MNFKFNLYLSNNEGLTDLWTIYIPYQHRRVDIAVSVCLSVRQIAETIRAGTTKNIYTKILKDCALIKFVLDFGHTP